MCSWCGLRSLRVAFEGARLEGRTEGALEPSLLSCHESVAMPWELPSKIKIRFLIVGAPGRQDLVCKTGFPWEAL